MNARTIILRTIAALVLIALLGLVALRIYENHHLHLAVQHYQQHAGSMNPRDYETSPVPEIENTATWLAKGAQATVVTPGETSRLLSTLYDTPEEKWKESDKAALKTILERNDAALQLLQKSVQYKLSSFSLDYSQGAAMKLPEPKLAYYLATTKLLTCKTKLQLLEHDFHGAAETARIQERIAAALEHEPVMIMGLVGHVAEKRYYNLIHRLLQTSDIQWMEATLQDLQHIKSMAQPLPRVIAADGAAMYITLQKGFPVDFNSSESQFQLLPWIYRVDRLGLMADALESDVEMVKLSRIPIQNWADTGVPRQDSWISASFRKELWRNDIEAIERFQAMESSRVLALTALQLSLEAAKSGRYPDQLSSDLSTITSPYTGKRLIYIVSTDGSATLSFPEDEKFWLRKREDFWVPQKPLFAWKLPAPHLSSAPRN